MQTLRHFYFLIRPYWFNRQQWLAWVILSLVLGLSLAIISIGVYINEWNKAFYDALTNFETPKILPLLGAYLWYIALVVLCVACGSWFRKLLLIRWRRHLTEELQEKWLAQHNLYRLTLKTEPDNPDQRIAEDAAMLASQSIDLVKNFVMNMAKIIAFVGILWEISGVLDFTLFGVAFQLHGYLVWLALIYTLVCSLFTHFIGRKLHPLNVEKQLAEADFRRTLLRLHDNAEQVAFYHGEVREQNRLGQYFAHIERNWHAIMGREFRLETFSASYLRITNILPVFAVLPLYLAKTITFGTMMQARSAFSSVQDGFGYFMDFYKRIMEWAATVQRLWEFNQALQQLPPYQAPPQQGEGLICENLQISLPNQHQARLQPISFSLSKGQWLHLKGASGIGKSAVLRTLSGLWPPFAGRFTLPAGRALFLPQKSYLPFGRLDEILCYPQDPQSIQADLTAILEDVGLGHLATELSVVQDWRNRLSGGEQQRIAFARVLLQQPALIFCDENTNQLDSASAQMLFALVKKRLPETMLVAVTHQQELSPLFDKALLLQLAK